MGKASRKKKLRKAAREGSPTEAEQRRAPAAERRYAPTRVDYIRRVRKADQYLQLQQDALRHAVIEARRRGHSWAEIGAGLGISRQAAWERFKHDEVQ
jgi:hypothetical protein